MAVSRLVTLACVTCLTLTLGVHAQVDRTSEAGGQGSALVEAVLAELHDACIYPEDTLFLRRLAYVETRDGTDPGTYTNPAYHGGIWKVDQSMLQRTQTESSRLAQQYSLIRSKLGINWSAVTWQDLRKPLYSALAASLFLTLEGAPANIPTTMDAQAAYWLTHFRKGQTTQTVQSFTGPVQTLQRMCARTEDMDLLFLVDTSSSVGPTQWTAITKFVSDIIINLSMHNGIGRDQDRVAMATFSDQARLSFGFDIGSDIQAALAQVGNAPRVPGGTNLSSALSVASSQVFPKARADAAKVAMVITDGKDSDPVSVVMNLIPLRLSDVTFFTVGVGIQVDNKQLEQIASAPTCSHSYHVTSHQQLDSLRTAVERISCRVPMVLSPGEYTYPCGFNVLAQVQGGSLGTSVTVSTHAGTVDVWGSYATQLPSADVHDLNHTATATSPAVIFSRDPRPLTLSVESEKLQGLLCSGNFTVRVDSQAAKRTDCNKRKPDLVFLLDTTLAASDADWTAMLSLVQSFSQQFDVSPDAAHVALVSFADRQTTHFRLGQQQSNAQLLQALRSISRPQGTVSNLPAALTYVSNQILSSGSRANASKTIVLITSGTINNAATAVAQAAPLHAQGARIVVVAVGSTFDDTTLNALSSGPQHVEKIPDVTALTSVVGDVIKEACGAVTVLCVEAGINRECHIEDLINMQYGNLLGPDHTVSFNPCALQVATGQTGAGGLHLNRFPHPSDGDKFLLCDSSGQAYVVLCPLGELYNPVLHECRNANGGVPGTPSAGGFTLLPTTAGVTTPVAVTVGPNTVPSLPYFTTAAPPGVTQQGNPCTPDAVVKQQYYHPYPQDPSMYYHCGAMPYVGQLESCPFGKVWYQAITQCVFTGVIVDQTTNQKDPNMPNPCTGGPGYFPAPNDANSYIQCNAVHEAFLKHCPPGEVWKPALTTCVFL